MAWDKLEPKESDNNIFFARGDTDLSIQAPHTSFRGGFFDLGVSGAFVPDAQRCNHKFCLHDFDEDRVLSCQHRTQIVAGTQHFEYFARHVLGLEGPLV